MTQLARCPSCGASVEFKSVASILAVCDYCQSTLIRQGEDLQNLGKMAALIEDRSPLQRGAEGSWRGRHFGLIGRIQLKYEQGLWNEWYLLFDDGKSGWLSEAGGEYVMSEATQLTDALPRFTDLRAGRRIALGTRTYTISNVLVAECVAGEGELPFKVGSGYPAPVADLRDEQGNFATLDYSDSDDNGANPLVFLGESVDFKGLAWNNLRSEIPLPQPKVQARAFNCPSCGAPLRVTQENIATIGCASCGAVLDPSDERVKILAKGSFEHKVEPLLELGAKGKLRGVAVEAIGFMRRRMQADGVDYYWSEYLLVGPESRLLWLTEYQGHWNLARVLSEAVTANAVSARYDKREYKHFASYTAYVDYVIGEFPWQVKLDEAVEVTDFVAPPLMLSREQTPSEVTWTVAVYLQSAEIDAAFNRKTPLPQPVGVYANQPNPHEEIHRRICRYFWMFALLALTIHFALLSFGPGGKLIEQSMTFSPNDDEPRLTPEFVLDGKTSRLELTHDTTVDNSWVALNAVLVNKDTGDNWQAMREISLYSGIEDGDSWSEGSRREEIVFTDLPPGHYLLAIESDMDAGTRPIQDHLRISALRAAPRWSSLFVLLAFLVAFPIYTRLRRGAFEIRRWAESDHPKITVSSGSDDD
jgi:ribosomal protein L37AE/L43A